MDPLLEQRLRNEARRQQLRVDPSFIRHLDSYVNRFFAGRPKKEQMVIQTYLTEAALRIAKTEGKQALELDDAKAAIYYFHLPDDPDSTCVAAGNRALFEERKRERYTRGLLLTEDLRRLLDEMK